jgi:hypothetical protein
MDHFLRIAVAGRLTTGNALLSSASRFATRRGANAGDALPFWDTATWRTKDATRWTQAACVSLRDLARHAVSLGKPNVSAHANVQTPLPLWRASRYKMAAAKSHRPQLQSPKATSETQCRNA